MAKLIRLLIMGPPGSGKGTISSRIIRDFNFAYLACGDLLRSHILRKTDEGLVAKDIIDKGDLVPDDLVTNLVFKELEQLSSNSWLLDGFPRTVKQAQDLSKKSSVSSVINLNVPHEVIIDRLKGRWLHVPSGRIYHTEFNPPKLHGIDDITGERLIQRSDDLPETVKARLEGYNKITKPVLDYYRAKDLLHEFTGRSSNEIWVYVREYLIESLKLTTYDCKPDLKKSSDKL